MTSLAALPVDQSYGILPIDGRGNNRRWDECPGTEAPAARSPHGGALPAFFWAIKTSRCPAASASLRGGWRLTRAGDAPAAFVRRRSDRFPAVDLRRLRGSVARRRHLALMPLGGGAKLARHAKINRPAEDFAITAPVKTDAAYQKCVSAHCGATYAIDDVRVACEACGGLLDVTYDWDRTR